MKILLIIYFISIIFYYLGWLCSVLELHAWMEEENIKTKKSKSRFASGLIKAIIFSLIPIINIIFAFCFLLSEEAMEKSKEQILERKIEED